MPETTTAEAALKGLELLRQEVPDNLVGKLPKVTCFECRKKENRGECKDHRKRKCDECGAWISPAHMHLDYVGHAETTSKLLEADLGWNWEPLAFGPDGLPAYDADGGLWIKLTVCGVTRLGYGTADNANGFKARGDIRKEIIGDALRNAAMRFGWALNLWAKTDIHDRTPQDEPTDNASLQRGAHAPEDDPWATRPDAPTTPSTAAQPVNGRGRPMTADEKRAKLLADFVDKIAKAETEEALGKIGPQVDEHVANKRLSPADRTVLEKAYARRMGELRPTVGEPA